tara:strand:+ start:21532 stop:22119 length:588 start_codon:yes stop_codon:yes gene_type:complete
MGLKELLHELSDTANQLNCLKTGEFILSSGATSSYYFDGRILTLNPKGASLIGSIVLELFTDLQIDAVAGPAVAAVPIISAVVVLSSLSSQNLSGIIMRAQPKTHGTKQSLEGDVVSGMKVVVVDDTCTTGGSLLSTIDALQQAGCTVVSCVCVLDRKEGGSSALEKRGVSLVSLLEIDQASKKIKPSSIALGTR